MSIAIESKSSPVADDLNSSVPESPDTIALEVSNIIF